MTRRPALQSRAIRAFTALATLWCLGCSAFEVLIDGAVGGRVTSAKECDSDCDRATGPAMPAGERAGLIPATYAAPDESDSASGSSCECDGCVAPDPLVTVAAIVGPLAPDADQEFPAAPTSADRVPLVPPPQAIA